VGWRPLAHRLVLPSLRTLGLWRSDDLDHLVLLWAPRLAEVNLRSCFGVSSVLLLNHLESSLPWLAQHYPAVAQRFESGHEDYTQKVRDYCNSFSLPVWPPLTLAPTLPILDLTLTLILIIHAPGSSPSERCLVLLRLYLFLTCS
jgi:hypothetical protein